jgi:hypothetical protein
MKSLIDTQPICSCTAQRGQEYRVRRCFPRHFIWKSSPLNIIQCLNLDGKAMKSSYLYHQEVFLDGGDMKFHINTIKKHILMVEIWKFISTPSRNEYLDGRDMKISYQHHQETRILMVKIWKVHIFAIKIPKSWW